MLRGINRQDIFEDELDYTTFIKILSAIRDKTQEGSKTKIVPCHFYAYCLMPNLVHLLLSEKDWTVSDVVKSIASSYVFYYNKRYGRIGHLFQDRFKSEPCDDSDYFLTLFRYIHQNPVKAKLVAKAEDYDFCSWRNDYLDLDSKYEKVCYTSAAVNRFGLTELESIVEQPLTEDVNCIDIGERRVVSDGSVRDLLLSTSGIRNIAEFQQLDKHDLKTIIRRVMQEMKVGPRQMSRVTGMSYNIVRNIGKQSQSI